VAARAEKALIYGRSFGSIREDIPDPWSNDIEGRVKSEWP